MNFELLRRTSLKADLDIWQPARRKRDVLLIKRNWSFDAKWMGNTFGPAI